MSESEDVDVWEENHISLRYMCTVHLNCIMNKCPTLFMIMSSTNGSRGSLLVVKAGVVVKRSLTGV